MHFLSLFLFCGESGALSQDFNIYKAGAFLLEPYPVPVSINYKTIFLRD
jgi:hypothetical protein